MSKFFLFLLLVGLAALGNYLRIPLFFGVDLIFGSIATLIAVTRLGLLPGVGVALGGGIVTLFLWQHPYAIVIFISEALFVGVLQKRLGSMLRADAAYWLTIGLPLVILFYAGIMDMAITRFSVIVLKQALNGVCNALLATLILMAWDAWRRPKHTFNISSITELAVFTAVMLPSLILVAMENRNLKGELETAVADELRLVASHIKMQASASLEESPGTHAPLVPGHSHREGLSPDHVSWIVRDGGGQPVWQSANWRDLIGGQIGKTDPGLAIWQPTSENLNTMGRWRASRYQYSETFTSNGKALRVLVEHPTAPVIDDLDKALIPSMLILAALVMLAGPLAILLSRFVARPITQLAEATRQITDAIDHRTDVSISRSRLTEVNQLAGDFREMSDSLNRAFADMAHLARHDTLTGICNRRRIMEYLEEEYLRAKRYGAQFCIVFYDFDDFKGINDELGHSVGDEVLVEVTNMVQGLIRQTDHIGRWGGDEFLLILSQTDLETARSVARKIEDTVAASRFSRARRRMTISAGIAGFSPGENVEQLIARVDDALYQSKQIAHQPKLSAVVENSIKTRGETAL